MKQLPDATINDFKGKFRGDVLLPGDAGYDEVRQIWNAMIDRKPALIARCKSAADVVQAVEFGRTNNLLDLDPRAAGTTSPAMPCATTAS